jgi:hypothetical protein
MKTLDEIFNKTITTKNGCMNWDGSCNSYGYGLLWNGKKHKLVTRIVMELLGNKIDNLLVCHKCDNPRCINPQHLFLGTAYDNVHDAMKKGRRPTAKHGELSMYTNNKCRCEKCRSTWNEYYRTRDRDRRRNDATG